MGDILDDNGVWNFVLTGQVRSGAGLVLLAINARKGAICYGGLLHHDPATRRQAHEANFGPSADPVKSPEWYVDGLTNPAQYIERVAFGEREGTRSIGVHLSYPDVQRHELYDLFEQRTREGSFGIVHVKRNPVSCFVSLKQAEATGVWKLGPKEKLTNCPMGVRVDPAELIEFCRNHQATEAKIRATCEDRLEIDYRDLLVDFQAVMRKVFDHIELQDLPELARPGCRRLKNKQTRERIANLAEVRALVPSEIRDLIEVGDLY